MPEMTLADLLAFLARAPGSPNAYLHDMPQSWIDEARAMGCPVERQIDTAGRHLRDVATVRVRGFDRVTIWGQDIPATDEELLAAMRAKRAA